MNRSFVLSSVLIGMLILSADAAFARPVPQPQRIPQGVIVNGQRATGVTVIQHGGVQTFSCPNPQPYTASDQSSGWACFDANTGTWLLHAMPPASANVYAGPQYYYPEEAPYGYYNDDDYAYSDIPYGYLLGPLFSFGFGFGDGHEHHEYYEHGGHEHGGHEHDGRHGHESGGHAGHGHDGDHHK